jgi:DUF4097 and DUF4098 domain-containing protein YvlB
MKRLLFVMTLLLLALSAIALAQNPERIVVPFSDPSRPGLVEVSLLNGGLSVKGYTGKEVIIEASTETEQLTRSESKNNKAKGMQKLTYNTTGLSVEEDDNVMEIHTESWKRTVQLTLQVPEKTNLKLNVTNDGDIVVENVQGEIDVNNLNGAVKLRNVGGSVVAHALNEDVEVILTQVNPNKEMSFSSLNGDIDVTLPANVNMNVKMKSTNGDIYSDFDIKLQPSSEKRVVEDERKEGGTYRVKFDEYLYGKINNGGPEVLFKTFQGDIFIRKGR